MTKRFLLGAGALVPLVLVVSFAGRDASAAAPVVTLTIHEKAYSTISKQEEVDVTITTDPPAQDANYSLEVTDPTGKQISFSHGTLDSVGRADTSFVVKKPAPNGTYKVKVTVGKQPEQEVVSQNVEIRLPVKVGWVLVTGPYAGAVVYADVDTDVAVASDNAATKADGKFTDTTTDAGPGMGRYNGTAGGKHSPDGGWKAIPFGRGNATFRVATHALNDEYVALASMNTKPPEFAYAGRMILDAIAGIRALREHVTALEKAKKLTSAGARSTRDLLDEVAKRDGEAHQAVHRLARGKGTDTERVKDRELVVDMLERNLPVKQGVWQLLVAVDAFGLPAEPPPKPKCRFVSARGAACSYRFSIGHLGITWVSTRDDGERVPGNFDVDSATACGKDPASAVWTTTQHASTSNNTKVNVKAIFTTGDRWQVYAGTVAGGAVSTYLRFNPGKSPTISLEADKVGNVELGAPTAPQPIAATPVASC